MSRIEGIRRILFIRTDRIGDTLMNIPAIHLLRQTYPKSWITLLCAPPVAELFREFPDLDDVMTVDREALKTPKAKNDLIQKICAEKFDLAVVSNPDKLFHWTIFRAGVPHRVGYNRKWGFLLTRSIIDDKDKCLRHEVESNLNLVKTVCDQEWDGSTPLPANTAAKAKVDDFLKRQGAAGPVIALHVGTTNPKKRWPIERFAELADKIQSKGMKVVLVGGREERSQGDRIFRHTILSLVDAIGVFSLNELTAFLSRPETKALVTSDSGPAHIAWMQGTPTVVFFAKDVPGSNPVRWGPRDGKSEVIEKSMADISADEAFAALEKVLAK